MAAILSSRMAMPSTNLRHIPLHLENTPLFRNTPVRRFTNSSLLRAVKNPKASPPPPPSSAAHAFPKVLPYSPTSAHRPRARDSSPAPKPATAESWQKYGLYGAGLVGMFAAIWALPFASALFNPPPTPSSGCRDGHLPAPTGRPAGLDISRAPTATARERREAAEEFDRGMRIPEWFTRITTLRKTLGVEAVGDVLELAVGTGRNFGYYEWKGVIGKGEAEGKEGGGQMKSFTGVDISPDMISVARDRLREAVPGLARIMRKRRAEPMPGSGLAVDVLDGKARLFVGDAEGLLPPPPGGEGKYDTVIQTFGLCSVAEPVKLLASAAGAVKPDTGRIILLEHGRGWWDWYNEWVVDRGAQRQFDRYGCWWNRDIELLVTEALKRVPGLELVALKRPFLSHFGTTLLVELKVNSKSLEGGRAKVNEGKGDDGAPSTDKPQPKGSSWWPLSS